MAGRILKPVLPLAASKCHAAVAHFRIWAVGGRWRLPGPMSADVRHMARPPGPLRSPPALRVPWGHAPPIWRPGGPRRRPHHARFGHWLGRRAWSAAARVVVYGCCATHPRARGGMGGLCAPGGPLGRLGAAVGVFIWPLGRFGEKITSVGGSWTESIYHPGFASFPVFVSCFPPLWDFLSFLL